MNNLRKKFMQLRGGSGGEERLEQLLKQAVVVQEDGIKKSVSDTRNYRTLILENELQVLLISDPKLEHAAASLTVNVGSYSDPPELYGLAHFLEHMLFLGTEQFPDESEYSQFLSNNGGYSNAYTASELTNYHFQVMSSELFGALERFSAFFKKPLFTETATDRELKAVDNECSGNQQNDMWRAFLIYCELANKDHPVHKFNIGNLETLKHEPTAKGINVRENLLSFYDRYYSANRMKLVVVGKEPLEGLQEYVEKLFSPVVNKKVDTPYTHPHPAGKAFSAEQNNLMKLVSVVPVKDVRRIELVWTLDRITYDNGRKEAMSYLGSLLGDEGEGSILSFLKKHSWANELSAGLEDDNFDGAAFQVVVHCTDLGITEHINDIVGVVYSYINMLHKEFEGNSAAYFFEEEKIAAAIRYWFQSERSPLPLASSLAAKMQGDIPIEEILTSGSLPTRDTFAQVKQILAELTPENSIMFVSTQTNEKVADREETYFKTKYGVADIPADLAAQWKNTTDYEKFGLKITPKNKFLPSTFDVHGFKKPKAAKLHPKSSGFLKKAADSLLVSSFKALSHGDIEDKRSVALDTIERDITETWEEDSFRRPVVLHSDEFSTLWYKQDTTFKRPKSIVQIFIKNPTISETVFGELATGMYISLVEDVLNEETYAAHNAGFHHSIGSNSNGVVLTFNGFSETIYKYIELVASKFKTFAEEDIDLALFERFKERQVKALKNTDKARPVSLARNNIELALSEKSHDLATKLTVVKEMGLDDMKGFLPTIFSPVSVEVFVIGNALMEDAKNCLEIATNVFKPTRSVSDMTYGRQVKLFDENIGPSQVFHMQSSRDDGNPGSGLVVNYQFGQRTDEKIALLSLFSEVLYERAFNQLRTKEQLGYIVSAGMGFDRGTLSLSVYVESNSVDPIALNARVENFIDVLENIFVDPKAEGAVTDETFDKLVNAEITSMSRRDTTLGSESGTWFSQIRSGLYAFDNRVDVMKAMANSKLDDLKQLLKEYFWNGAPQRAKFVSGILADVHGTKLFGEKYLEEIKINPREDGTRLGFDEEFVMAWLQKDKEAFDKLVAPRGKILVTSDLAAFKSEAEFFPTYQEILSAKL